MEVNVVVIFYSRYGQTEALGLAAAVGAIQARGNVRIRKITEIAGQETIDSDPRWKENFGRMTQEYIAPREIDLEWADVVVLGSPSQTPDEMNRYLGALKNMPGKIAAPFTPGAITHGEKNAALLALYGAAAGCGMTVVPVSSEAAAEPVLAARAHVRGVVEMSRALKSYRADSNKAAAP
jgi:NAD(P)H dehydrogenase (quinone)